ncbi:MAG: PTS ascorbate transporter subunit IIC [Corynebacterium sp.]|uniref:PTS ascorbate transporter subunit IIC n=1 Tax=unclassified Corynebacterium TaxID=2624378 RepID=UPI00264A2B64|nr:PTS ascorbate transporter subunit IIC [Corynebacterium sp.]MDN5582425.1 PTS ascorbate transporter subunit IIC [Corynebacterium sp.]MDN5719643.1 PTS ascorbate transporter subunit IIC [Corynebacterium sp.]MDN6259630.1 PTS ascorbate transporter subunit IIC [Corynebacterium sp.]MDN6324845.1 PTS ascorbate transporter subunit IIC [Corynebacterium sp.]MDN6509146.1 PTS ascorbate transporter subunit IIC [Corynebacterium sp.]
MDWLLAIPTFIVNEILAVPAFLIGIFTAIGLIAMRRSAGQVAGGAIKAILGFLLIGAGATLVTASLDPLGVMIEGATGMHGVVPTNEAIAGIAQEEFGSQVAWLMILGYVVSLLFARFTPLRYVFLTGHHVLFMATMITIILVTADYADWIVVGLGAVLLGVLMVALPALAHPWTRKVTGDDSVAIGHFGTAGYIAAGAVGKAVGGKGAKASKSSEDLKVPEGLRFLRDSMVATALSMVLMYLVLAILYVVRAGQDEAFAAFGEDSVATDLGNYLMQAVTQGLQFGVAVAVILFGVRTILGELVPAFQGIAAKVVPGAIPALDAPIVFPYAQNAVLIGFISSFSGGLVALVILSTWLNPAFGAALILPGLVPHFFTGGAAGVYGNATGGRRGAVLGAFVNGVIITILPAFLINVLGDMSGENTTFGDADFGWFGLLIGNAPAGVWGLVVIVAVAVAVFAAALVVQKKLVDGNWDAAPGRSAGSWIGEGAEEGTENAGDAAGAGATGAMQDASAGASGATAAYSRIAPPKGAPTPPAPPAE